MASPFLRHIAKEGGGVGAVAPNKRRLKETELSLLSILLLAYGRQPVKMYSFDKIMEMQALL